MLHVSAFRCVQFDVVLGQDLHDRPDLQPPLCLWDAMPAADRGRESNSPLHLLLVLYTTYMSYSKSVSSFKSARGWKVSALFLMPRTQAESGVLAKMRPKGHG